LALLDGSQHLHDLFPPSEYFRPLVPIVRRQLSHDADAVLTTFSSAVAQEVRRLQQIPETPIVMLRRDVFCIYLVGAKDGQRRLYGPVGGRSLKEFKTIYEFLHTVRALGQYVKEKEAYFDHAQKGDSTPLDLKYHGSALWKSDFRRHAPSVRLLGCGFPTSVHFAGAPLPRILVMVSARF
jgi:hypothetical protein